MPVNGAAYRGWSSGERSGSIAVGVIGWMVVLVFGLVFVSLGGGR